MHALNAAIRAVVAIQEFNTRLVKTNSGGRATFSAMSAAAPFWLAKPVSRSIPFPTETREEKE